jgi:hypothetical protein
VLTAFIIWAVTVIVAGLVVLLRGDGRLPRALELILVTWLFSCGLQALFAASGHLFQPEQTAESIGWAASPRFQFEVGIANLAIAVLLIGCVRSRGGWMTAAVVAFSIWLWGDAVGHVISWVDTGDSAAGNTGWAFVLDLVNPLVALILFLWWRRVRPGPRPLIRY